MDGRMEILSVDFGSFMQFGLFFFFIFARTARLGNISVPEREWVC